MTLGRNALGSCRGGFKACQAIYAGIEMTIASRLIEPDRVSVGSGATGLAPEQLDVVKRTILFLFVLIFGFYLFLGVVLLVRSNSISDAAAFWHIAVARTSWPP